MEDDFIIDLDEAKQRLGLAPRRVNLGGTPLKRILPSLDQLAKTRGLGFLSTLGELAREHGSLIPIRTGDMVRNPETPLQYHGSYLFYLPETPGNPARAFDTLAKKETKDPQVVPIGGGNALFRLPMDGGYLSTVAHNCRSPNGCAPVALWSGVHGGAVPFREVVSELQGLSHEVGGRDVLIHGSPHRATDRYLHRHGFTETDSPENWQMKTLDRLALDYPFDEFPDNLIARVTDGEMWGSNHVYHMFRGQPVESSRAALLARGDRPIVEIDYAPENPPPWLKP